jgi:SEC-C motif domain protein
MKSCPCHSGKLYAECCEPFHRGASPQNALELMRSRYAAYALLLGDYIMDTTHPKNASWSINRAEWKKQIIHFCSSTHYEGLKIVSFVDGAENASVTFTAKLSQNGRDVSFTEQSRFEKEGGRWLYHSGQITPAN